MFFFSEVACFLPLKRNGDKHLSGDSALDGFVGTMPGPRAQGHGQIQLARVMLARS